MMESKTFTCKVLSIEENGDAIIELPPELCEMMKWNDGTLLNISQNELGQIILKEIKNV